MVIRRTTTTEAPRWWPQDGEEPDPRWSLANERTLLAYVRTALALIVSGLAIIGSHEAAGTSRLFAAGGVPFVLLGGLVGWAGRDRFVSSQRAMRLGTPLAAPRIASMVPVMVAVIAAVVTGAGVLQLASVI